MKNICDFGTEQVFLSKLGITMGKLLLCSSSVCLKYSSQILCVHCVHCLIGLTGLLISLTLIIIRRVKDFSCSRFSKHSWIAESRRVPRRVWEAFLQAASSSS